MREVIVGDIKIGVKNPLILIAGPCVIESERSAMYHASYLKRMSERLDIPLIFKSSYEKANRSSIASFSGLGIKRGLRILKKIKDEYDLPILSDVHCREEIKEASEILDVIQIPAFLSRQTALLIAAAKTKRVVNVKKGQFLSPWDVKNIIEKIASAGNKRILITERGASFGYNNLISDMRALPIIRGLGYPVIFDASHSTQLPGGLGKSSGGERRFIPVLARAAVAAGCDGVFIEVHQTPHKALCDGPNMLPLGELEDLLIQLKEIDEVLR